jgi:O-antigen/teichoic acid export membrane protein
MAFAGYGVWALVAQQLSRAVIWAVLLWIINKWFPKLRFSKTSFHELFGFGWKIMISWLLETIWRELFQAIIGKFYSPAALGQYTRSLHFSQLLSTNLTNVIQRVTYPVLSDIQDDKTRMLSAYRKIIKTTMFATIISMFTLGAISEPLLYCLIGPQWHDAAVYLPLICLNGSLYPLHAINLNMLQVQGRSDLFLGLEIIKKIVGVGPLCVGAFIGIMPMLYTNLLAGIIAFFLNSYYSGKFLGYSSWMQIKDILPSFWIGLLISCIVYFVKFVPMSYWIILPIQIMISVLLFFIVCNISNNQEYVEIRNMISPYLKRLR